LIPSCLLLASLCLPRGVAAEDEIYDLARAVDDDILMATGSAFLMADDEGLFIELTPAETNAAGSIFSRASTDATAFETYFSFRIEDRGGGPFGCNDEPGADGLAFVIMPAPDGLGIEGGGLGYEGMGRLISVEFDTFCNDNLDDLDSNHAAILLGGDSQHFEGHPFTASVAPDFDLGDEWYAWIDYDGTYLSLRLGIGPERPLEPLLVRDLDIPGVVGGPRAHLGFTAGTGSAFGRHMVTDWVHVGDLEQEREPEPDTESDEASGPAASRGGRGGGGRGGGGRGSDDSSESETPEMRPLGTRTDYSGTEQASTGTQASESESEHGSARGQSEGADGSRASERQNPDADRSESGTVPESEASEPEGEEARPEESESGSSADRERVSAPREGASRPDDAAADPAGEESPPSTGSGPLLLWCAAVVAFGLTAWVILRRRR